MVDDLEMDRIRTVKAKYERRLLRKRYVVGVGIGLRERGGELTEEATLTVLVSHKLPQSELRPRDRIPAELDGVPVDVQVVGHVRAL